MIIVDQMRDMLMRGLNSKLGREVQSQSMDFIYNNQKQLMWGFGSLFGFIALITSPIWITMAVLSSPFIIAGVLLQQKTFNPIIKFLIRQFFELYTSNYQKNDLTFLNGGYADSEIENGVFLKTYKDKFGEVNSMNGLNLLETGCGRGGGLHYLAREMNPQSALGIDIARSQIEYCKKHWMGDKLNLNFIQHDVENLESIISRNTIDYAIDIESSMFYPNKSRFLIYNLIKHQYKSQYSLERQARLLEEMEFSCLEQLLNKIQSNQL